MGDRVRVLPSGVESRVAEVVTLDGKLERAAAGQSVTIVLADDVDVSRGDVLTGIAQPARVGTRLKARLFWTGENALKVGDEIYLKLATASATARIEAIQHRIDPDSAEAHQAAHLSANDIADVTVVVDRAVAFDPYEVCRATGSFILIDRESLDTAGIGLVLATEEPEPAAKAHWIRSLLQRLRGATPMSRYKAAPPPC